jgi:hypothetical protein
MLCENPAVDATHEEAAGVHDGDVYASWPSGDLPKPGSQAGMSVVRRRFGATMPITEFTPYAPFVVARDCGDRSFFCGDPGVLFFRVPLKHLLGPKPVSLICNAEWPGPPLNL